MASPVDRKMRDIKANARRVTDAQELAEIGESPAEPNVSSAPRPSAGPGWSSDGREHLSNYLNAFARPSTWRHNQALIRAAEQAEGFGTVPYKTKQGKTANYAPEWHNNMSLDDMLATPLAKTGLSREDFVAAATPEGTEEALIAMMKGNQRITGAQYYNTNRAVNRTVDGLSADLVSEDEARRKLALGAMGLDPKQLQEIYAPGSAAIPQDATGGIPEWVPHLKDMPALQTGLAYGVLAAGTGAAALATANMLAQQGAQQQSNAQYAALMQQANAY